jgi:hypothetical protein
MGRAALLAPAAHADALGGELAAPGSDSIAATVSELMVAVEDIRSQLVGTEGLVKQAAVFEKAHAVLVEALSTADEA